MKRVVRVACVGAVGLTLFACSQAQQQPPPGWQLPPEAREAIAVLEEWRQHTDTLHVTVRGRSIHGRGWSSGELPAPPGKPVEQARGERAPQKPMPPGLVRRVVERYDVDGRPRVALEVGIDPESLVTISMADSTEHEGRLFRIHIDQPETPGDQLIVIGYYDRLWSDAAVNDQRVTCWECSGVKVCSAEPKCGR
jgi:hypothetical protein